MKNESGFTLLELIIVLTLIGLMAGLALPLFSRSLDTLVTKTTVRQIAATLRRARSMAVSGKKDVVFYLDMTGREYFVVQEQTTSLRQTLKKEITIKGFLNAGESDPETDGIAAIMFYPQGNSSGGSIVIESVKDESEYIMTIERLSGRVTIDKQE